MQRIAIAGLYLCSHFMLSMSVAHAQATWRLVEDLRIGGADSGVTFASVGGIAASSEGNIFVLEDRQLRMFDRGGKFVKLAGRGGDGPGELGRAMGMLVKDSLIWVYQPGRPRTAFRLSNGAFFKEVELSSSPGISIWFYGFDAEGRFLDPIDVYSRANGTTGASVAELRVRRSRIDGAITDTVNAPRCALTNPPARRSFSGTTARGGSIPISIPFLAAPLWVFDGQGGFWCSPNDAYTIVRRSLVSGDTLAVVRTAFTRVPVAAKERDDAIAGIERASVRYTRVDVDFRLIPAVHPVFRRLVVDDRGQLWAWKTQQTRAPSTADIYDATGRKVATITSAMQLDPTAPLHFTADYLFTVVLDSDDVPYVVRLRIERSGS